MPAFAPKMSQEQRAAIVEYALRPGSSARAAWRAARGGDLPGGALDIGYTRVAELVAAEREHRNGRRSRKIAEKGAGKACDLLVGDMLNLAERESRQLRNRNANQPVDTERLRRLARAVREIRAAADANASPSRNGKPDATGKGAEERAGTLLEQLAGDEANAGPSSETHQDTGETETIAPKGSEGEPREEEQQAGEAGQAVHGSARDVEPLGV